MVKKSVVVIAILLVLFISGCTTPGNPGSGAKITPIRDIAEATEKHDGGGVTIRGEYSSQYFVSLDPHYKSRIIHRLSDAEGYYFEINENCMKNRVFEGGESYTITGLVRDSNIDCGSCVCQIRKIDKIIKEKIIENLNEEECIEQGYTWFGDVGLRRGNEWIRNACLYGKYTYKWEDTVIVERDKCVNQGNLKRRCKP